MWDFLVPLIVRAGVNSARALSRENSRNTRRL